MSSSTQDHRHVSAPPPTPSATDSSSSETLPSSLLSHLLLRLPPTLSLPTRRPATTTTTTPPLVFFSSETFPSSLVSAATQLGFLQLNNHSVSHELVQSAESESFSLFPPKTDVSPRTWPVGYDQDDDHEFQQELLCFDAASFTESTQSLGELASELERVGMKVLEGVGFGAQMVQPLMWVSVTGQGGHLDGSGRVYPYVIGLEYQIRLRKMLLFGDSGSVSVSPQVDSILVTFGDIAQVWSNGKIKKVRGRPVPVISGEISNNCNENTTKCVSMTMLLTLPLESIVSPQLPQTLKSVQHEKDDERDEATTFHDEVAMFDSFSFEDYAWRVYHDRLHLKDSLDRYRLI